MRTFGKQLRKARKARFPSAQQFSAIIGLEPHTYRKYERGQSEPNFEILVRICEALEIEASELLPISKDRKRGSSHSAAA